MLQAPSAARDSGRIWLLAYLAFFVALSFAKAPGIFIDPRFWAEEGRDYFVWMRGLPLWEALIFTAKRSLQVWPGGPNWTLTLRP